jgi:hypothetical protein
LFGPGTLSPRACLILGVILIALGGVEIAVVTFRPDWWKRAGFRWKHARRPLVSRFSGFATGLFFVAFGATAILDGYLGVLSQAGAAGLLFTTFGLCVLGAIVDCFCRDRRQ